MQCPLATHVDHLIPQPPPAHPMQPRQQRPSRPGAARPRRAHLTHRHRSSPLQVQLRGLLVVPVWPAPALLPLQLQQLVILQQLPPSAPRGRAEELLRPHPAPRLPQQGCSGHHRQPQQAQCAATPVVECAALRHRRRQHRQRRQRPRLRKIRA